MPYGLWPLANLSVFGSSTNGSYVFKVVVTEKELDDTKQESAKMYIMDLVAFGPVPLTTREMTFQLGSLRIPLIVFCQLAGITGNRPEALLQLRYQHLKLTLIQDYDNPRPRLFIGLTTKFTKGFLGIKDAYVPPPLLFTSD